MFSISDYEFIPLENFASLPKSGNYKTRKDYYYLLIDGKILKHKTYKSIMCNPDKRVIDFILEKMPTDAFKDLKVEIIHIKYTFEEI